MQTPTLSVIVSTYEWPRALDVVLRALAEQEGPRFEIVVADDGSGVETAAVVDAWNSRVGDVRHVWHEDSGWRKARVLNLAARASTGHYLLFLDGDCIPRRRLVAAVRRAMVPGVFVAGKRTNLSAEAAQQVLAGVPLWRRSALRLLVSGAVSRRHAGVVLVGRDRRRAWRATTPEFSAPYAAYGFLFGVFRDDFEGVNGFDMRYVGWGEEDVDIALRLRRRGLRCGWPGPASTPLHLPHPRAKGAHPSNSRLLADTRTSRRVGAVEGLAQLVGEHQAGAG